MFELQQALWSLRRDPALPERLRQDPDAVLAPYDLDDEDRAALRTGDFKALYEKGANPYLLYFYALQAGVERSAYYANIRGEGSGEPARG